MLSRFSLVLERGKLGDGGRLNEVLDALFCMVNLASVYSKFCVGAILIVWKDL